MTQTKSKNHVEKHFNKTYKEFDSFYREKKNIFSRILDTLFRRSMQMRFEKVIETVAPYKGRTVLDVGCGTGRFSIALALKGIKKALGLDFAPNMIEEANLLARQYNVQSICDFKTADFMDMDLKESYDYVIAMGVLDYIDDPIPFVKNMRLRATNSVMVSFPLKGGIIQKLRKFKFEKIQKCPVYFYSLEDVQRIADKSGAETIAIEKMAKDYFLTIYIQS